MRRTSQSGFTLVEVLVAAVVLAIGIMGAMRAVSGSTLASARSRDLVEAATLAKQQMSELLQTQPISTGANSGDFGPGYPGFQWDSEVEQSANIEGLLQVAVVVSWRDGVNTSKYTLVTQTPQPPSQNGTGSTTGTATGSTTTGG